MKKLLVVFLSILFFACGTDDVCDSVTCFNQGTCVDGTCVCPEGYTGSDCTLLVTPSSMTISEIRLTEMPERQSDGSEWDINDYPDVLFKLSRNGTTFTSETVSNADPSSTISWPVNIQLNSVDEIHTITFYDEDVVEDDLIGAAAIIPWSERFDEVLVYVDGGIVFEMVVSYSF